MRIRLKFRKEGPIRFVGHLDFLRTFQKIFRKADIHIAFTEGFNPHPIFSIAAPLSVGVTSEGEYLDLEIDEKMELSVVVQKLNEACPGGLEIISAVQIADKKPSAMSAVSASSYIVSYKGTNELFSQEKVNAFYARTEIITQKTTKSGQIKDFDLRPGIYELRFSGNEFSMILASGSTFNIKPEIVIEALCVSMNESYNPFDYHVHRVELYHGTEELIPMSVPILEL